MLDKPQVGQPLAPNLIRYKNGAIYDRNIGRIISNPGGGTAAITPATSSDMLAKRLERKRQVARAAANEAVERDDWKITHGDMAYVAAIVDTLMTKATTADDAKAVDAGRAVMQMTGMEETRVIDHQASSVPAVVNVIVGLVQAQDMSELGYVDAETTDADE